MNQRKAGVILSYISEAVKILSGLIYTPIMLRLLGRSEYGLYQLVYSVVSYLGLLSLGFSSSYIRFYSRYQAQDDEDGIARLNGMFMTIFLVIAGICILCGSVMVENVGSILGSNLSPDELSKARILMIFMVFNLALTFPGSVFSCYLTAHEKFIFQKGLALLQSILNPFLTLPFLIVGYGSVGMVAVTTCLTVASFLCNVYYCIRKNHMHFLFSHFQLGLFGEMFRFTFFIFLNQIIDQVNWSVDKYLLGRMSGTGAVAVYGVGSQLNAMIISFSTAISNVFVPEVHRIVARDNGSGKLSELFVKVGRIQYFVMALVISGFVFFGRPFIIFWAGSDYAQAYPVTVLLIVSVMVPLTQNIGIEIQRAKNMHQARSIVYTVISIGNILISIPLIYYWGPTGAATGTAIALVIGNTFFMNWYYASHIGIDIRSFWKNIWQVTRALLFPLLLGTAIMLFVEMDTVFMLLIGILVYSLCYAGCSYFFGMNETEKGLVTGLVKKIVAQGRKVVEKIYGKTEECCGCGACAEICLRGCIQMCMDQEGFLYPVVDRERCVACGLCQRICPAKNAVARGDAIRGHYLAYVKDEKLRWNSSSGGVFSVLAEAILKNGGVVFGAAFDEDFSVHHIGVKDSSGLDALRGSKYVESRTEHSFSEAKAVLEAGKPVLFSGTPCQIAGLTQYLGKNYDRLYTVDLLCHGVPSPKVWKMYLNFQISAQCADIKRTLFRQKDFGWKAYAVKLQFDNLTAYEQIFEKDLFMQMFLQNICLRPSCYACKFKRLNRVSDFTIGDAWGVENYMPEMDDDKGTSVILVHTKKGEKLLNEVQEQMKMMPGREGQLLPSVLASRSSVSRHPRRKQFFQKLDQVKSFDELAVFLKVSLPRKVVRKMKRGVKKLWGS